MAARSMQVLLPVPNQVPYQLPDDVTPDSTWQTIPITAIPIPVVEDLVNAARSQHPKLRSLEFKNEILTIERRLKKQQLLPSLNINYNFLQKGYEPWKGIGRYFLQNNYKYGVEFKMPLFLREARGEVSLANIKLKTNELQKSQAMVEIENKVRNYFNRWQALSSQVQLYEDALQNYQRLLSAEEVKFSIGESSLFLLNSRENKLLETRQKIIELKTKFFTSQVALQWAAGLLR